MKKTLYRNGRPILGSRVHKSRRVIVDKLAAEALGRLAKARLVNEEVRS
jgi:hypothetical protein